MEKPTPQGDIIISYPGYQPLIIRGSVEVNPIPVPDSVEQTPED